MCHYLGGGLHGRQKRVKAQSESSKSVVNSVLISREMPVFPGFLEIIRVVILKILTTLNDKFSSLNCLALEPEIVLIKTLDSCLYNLIRGMLEKWQCIKENECTMRGEILCWLLRKYITITYNIKGE